jgi:hypothetical protein
MYQFTAQGGQRRVPYFLKRPSPLPAPKSESRRAFSVSRPFPMCPDRLPSQPLRSPKTWPTPGRHSPTTRSGWQKCVIHSQPITAHMTSAARVEPLAFRYGARLLAARACQAVPDWVAAPLPCFGPPVPGFRALAAGPCAGCCRRPVPAGRYRSAPRPVPRPQGSEREHRRAGRSAAP